MRPAGPRSSAWLAVGGGVAGMLFVFAIAQLVFPRIRSTASNNPCINNLRWIDGAKQQWAFDLGKPSNAVPSWSDISHYFIREPVCPQGGRYVIRAVYETPLCSFGDGVEGRFRRAMALVAVIGPGFLLSLFILVLLEKK